MAQTDEARPATGRVALVTGGSRGIGRAIAQRLARAGAFVVVSSRHPDACEQVVAELREDGGRAGCVRLDVGELDEVEGAVAAAAELAGQPVDWLVNNAGIALSAPLLAREERDLFEEHLRVNFHGARRLIEALLPGMRERGYGRIVNVASSAGLRGYAYVSAYCASKHALVGYSRAAAMELERGGVKLNVVCPHYVDSPMTDRSVARVMERTGRSEAETRRQFAAQNPGGRLVTTEEVASAVLELLSGEANGRIVELDGAMRRVVEPGSA